MSRKKKSQNISNVILLHQPDVEGSQKEFELSHAERLLDYEEKRNLKRWELSDKNLTFENGSIRPVDDSKADSENQSEQGS